MTQVYSVSKVEAHPHFGRFLEKRANDVGAGVQAVAKAVKVTPKTFWLWRQVEHSSEATISDRYKPSLARALGYDSWELLVAMADTTPMPPPSGKELAGLDAPQRIVVRRLSHKIVEEYAASLAESRKLVRAIEKLIGQLKALHPPHTAKELAEIKRAEDMVSKAKRKIRSHEAVLADERKRMDEIDIGSVLVDAKPSKRPHVNYLIKDKDDGSEDFSKHQLGSDGSKGKTKGEGKKS